jgi:hypothetical protein
MEVRSIVNLDYLNQVITGAVPPIGELFEVDSMKPENGTG